MAEKQGYPLTEPPPPSYEQVVGYQKYGTGAGVPSYAASGLTGYNTNYGTGSQTVLMRQPAAFSGSLNPVPDHMGLALFATVLCCWPIGIFAIFKAQDARRASERGDLPSAMMLSAKSRRYSQMAIGLGVITSIVVVIVISVALTTTVHHHVH